MQIVAKKAPQRAKKGKKRRKVDRNRKWCEAYRARGQREKNKARRLIKHLEGHPGDRCAAGCLDRIGGRRKAAP